MGQVPALLHVATCEQSCQVTEPADVECAHGCKHSVPSHESESTDDSAPAGDHDSDSCVVCQSLALAGDVPRLIDLGDISQLCVDQTPLMQSAEVTSATQSIADPRGPPARTI